MKYVPVWKTGGIECAIVVAALCLPYGPATAASGPLFSAPFLGFSVAGPGTSVGAGDLDNDGKQDVVVSVANAGVLSVLFGNGDGTLRQKQDIFAGSSPRSATITDLNADGIPDIVVALRGSGSISVILGQGGGAFAAKVEYSVGGSPNSLAVGDLNEDGVVDVAAVTTANALAVMLGNGDGSFSGPTNYLTSPVPVSVRAVDLNGDSHLDLIVADVGNDGFNSYISIFQGHGDGTLSPKIDYVFTPTILGSGMVVADLNQDGKVDVALPCQDRVVVLPGLGNGSFGPQIDHLSSAPRSVAVGDMNADGIADLLVAHSSDFSVSVAVGNGDGTFESDVAHSTGHSPGPVAVTDLNGDSRLDIVAASEQSTTLSVLLGNGDASFGQDNRYSPLTNQTGMALGDINGDGRVDAVTLDHNTAGTMVVLLGQADGSFVEATRMSVGAGAVRVAVAEFNGDGYLDIATVNTGVYPDFVGSVSVFLNNAGGGFSRVDYPAGGDASAIQSVDLDKDGAVDLVVANSDDNSVSVMLGRGDGTFDPKVDYYAGTSPSTLAVADLNEDGNQDVIVGGGLPQSIFVLPGDGLGNLLPGSSRPQGQKITFLAIDDLNGDGHADVVAGNNELARILVLRGLGDGSFQSASILSTGTGNIYNTAHDVTIANLDSDSIKDIVLAKYNDRVVSVMSGLGGAAFGPEHLYGTNGPPFIVRTADIDANGRRDIVAGNNGLSIRFNLNPDIVTATELVLFEGKWCPAGVELRWQFGSSIDDRSVILERSYAIHGPWVSLGCDRLRDQGTTVAVDGGVDGNRVAYYRLVARGLNGESAIFGPVVVNAGGGAAEIVVSPSPSRGPIGVLLRLRSSGQARLRVMDVEGRSVTSLIDEDLKAGEYRANWDGRKEGVAVAPGLYFLKLDGVQDRTQRIVLVR